MATSKMKVSTLDYHYVQNTYSDEGNVRISRSESHSTFAEESSHKIKHSQSSIPDFKNECSHSKDVSKRKRVNRTAKLKQCKLDARREQWLSQGNHCRIKHKDQDYNGILAQKPSDKRSGDHLSEKCPPSDSECQVSSQITAGLVNHVAQNREIESSTCTFSMCGDGSNQAVSLRWEDVQQSGLLEGSYTKSKCVNKIFRPALIPHGDSMVNVEGVGMMHECCLTDGANISVKNMPLSPVVESSIVIIGKKTSDGSLCMVEAFLRDKEKLMSNSDKQENSSVSLSCCGRDTSATQTSSSCTSSGYTGSSCDDNGNLHAHDEEDDWEAVADAIHVEGSVCKSADPLNLGSVEKVKLVERKATLSVAGGPQEGDLMPEYKYKTSIVAGRVRELAGRAWRPDDAARPPTLPRLSKPHSFALPLNAPAWNELHGTLWGPPSAPLSCPICTEELDVTDSSFVPCSCGFRLCLFCHHRIASEDGRCPGCRKTYNSDVAMKLSHSSSVWLRI